MIWFAHGGIDQIPKQIWVFIYDGDRGGGNRQSHGSPALSEDIPDHESWGVGQSGSGALGRSLLVGPGGGSTGDGLLPGGSGLGGGGGGGERRGLVLLVMEFMVMELKLEFMVMEVEVEVEELLIYTQIEVEVGIHGNGIEIGIHGNGSRSRS
ncbi:hypothetical protein C1H46_039652 [Malus baccata]|uniref:Uncharacterized protein n=1 Tax=Malus baccata TaxID=106549 RepID=A0A540KKS0_MALBA|nr:hypothetical protein C1H46_039652 [Malus baccata]